MTMKLDIAKIPAKVLSDIREREIADEDIGQLSPEEAFGEYCNWHGLTHWGNQLASALDSLRAASTAESVHDKLLREARAAFAVIANNSTDLHVREFATQWFTNLQKPVEQAAQQAPDLLAPVANEAVTGFVLVFPGADDAEGDELLDSLRQAGTEVYRASDSAEAAVLLAGRPSNDASQEITQPDMAG